MKALRLESIGRLEVVDIDEPSPVPGEVMIKTIATGICGSDIHGYTGENGRRIPGQVMGHETVGRVFEIGSDVDPERHPVGGLVTINPLIVSLASNGRYDGREQHDPGRRVIGVDPTIVSAFAEYLVVPALNVVALPAMALPAHGALIEPIAVALHAVARAEIAAGEIVLVLGGGPIGQSVVLAARRAGAAAIFVSEPNEARRRLCESLGAVGIDPRAGDVPDQVRALNGGALVDAAVDAVGASATLSDALESTVFGGRVCLVGMASPSVALDAYRISTDERKLIGSFTYPAHTLREAAQWVGQGQSDLASLVSEIIAPEEADEMFQRLARSLDIPGKVLIRFDSDFA